MYYHPEVYIEDIVDKSIAVTSSQTVSMHCENILMFKIPHNTFRISCVDFLENKLIENPRKSNKNYQFPRYFWMKELNLITLNMVWLRALLDLYFSNED